jgi:DUF1365 family protein
VTASAVDALPSLPALVVGRVSHSRLGQVRHSFRHTAYLWLVDLDAIPEPPTFFARSRASAVPTTSVTRHCRSRRTSSDSWHSAGIGLGHGARVLMLANARILGHVFDPLSVFWCYDSRGHLSCVVAEVHNTYGERHAYLLRPDPDGKAEHAKELYVSPFFDVSGGYQLRFAMGPDLVSTTWHCALQVARLLRHLSRSPGACDAGRHCSNSWSADP